MQCYKLDLREAGKGQAMGLSPRGSVAVLAGKDKFEVIGLNTIDRVSAEWGEEWNPSEGITRKSHGHRLVETRGGQTNFISHWIGMNLVGSQED